MPRRAPSALGSRSHRRDARTFALYALALVREFRWTFGLLAAALAVGALLYRLTPMPALDGRRPGTPMALYAAWMSLFAQPVDLPSTWYLGVVDAVYPLVGILLVGEGVVRFVLLMASRRHGEKEWMTVMASTYRDHVVLCGLGHLGIRVLGELLAQKTPVVCIERDTTGRFLDEARATGVPILVRDMKDDQALLDAGIEHARSVIIATNDDMANIEVAMDSRRYNPSIRVIMRLFDQRIASKIHDAFAIDHAFSSAAIAAPAVAAMALDARVRASFEVGGVPHVVAELPVGAGGRTVAELERASGARVLALLDAGAAAAQAPGGEQAVPAGARLLVHVAAERVAAVASALQ